VTPAIVAAAMMKQRGQLVQLISKIACITHAANLWR